jgi:hypothetical protein
LFDVRFIPLPTPENETEVTNDAKEEVNRYEKATIDELNNIDKLNDNTDDDDLFRDF